MLFAQHGPAWKPKLEILFENQLIGGVIWDPREETVDRIKEIRASNDDYLSVKNIIDLKVYYKQFPKSIPKRLDQLDYYPKQNIDRTFLRNTKNTIELVQKSIDFQLDFNVDLMMSPSLYLYSFNERIVDKLFDLWMVFHEQIQEKEITVEKYISVIFHETALENESYITEFLDDFSEISNNFDGIYIIIDREKDNNHRHAFNTNRLNGMLQLIYDLKNLGLSVVIGYSGIESILYFAVGADAIGTGWFYSLRNFNKEQKGLEPVEAMGRQKKRYTSMKMLFELAIEEQILGIPAADRDKLYDNIFTGCKLDSKVKEGNIDDINLNDIYQQYFEALKQVVDSVKDQRTIEAKIEYVDQLLNTAESNIEQYNNSTALAKINGRHIQDYKAAINKFKEDNFIFI